MARLDTNEHSEGGPTFRLPSLRRDGTAGGGARWPERTTTHGNAEYDITLQQILEVFKTKPPQVF